MAPVANLVEPLLICASGIMMICFPRLLRRRAERRHFDRLAELEAPERFFEERRSLQTYRPIKRDSVLQLVGIGMTLFGIILIYVNLVEPA